MSLVHDLPLLILPDKLAVCRLPADAALPEWARPGDLLAFIQTRFELTVVCPERFVPPEVVAERNWRAFMVQGPLDFSLTGVLAGIAAPLAEAALSIFAISTYETDYVLVRDEAIGKAVQALTQAGFLVLDHDHLPA
jgi:hypothetical protein